MMTHDLPAIPPSFVPPDFGKFDSVFENLPTIDPLMQFSHFSEKDNDNTTLIQNTNLVVLQQNQKVT